MDMLERASALVKRAEALGLRFQFDNGFVKLIARKDTDPLVLKFIGEELAKYVPQVRDIVARRAVGARAKELIGSHVVSHEFEGTLTGGSPDGKLSVSTLNGAGTRSISIVTSVESLLLIVSDEEETTDLVNVESKPSERRLGILEFLRRSSTQGRA